MALKILLKTNESYFTQKGNKQLVKNNNLIHSSRVSLDYLVKEGKNVMHSRNIFILKQRSTLASNTTKYSFQEPMTFKISKKLSTLRGKNLTFPGRICLIKSIISVIPLYFLFFYKVNVSVCKFITKL